MEGLSDSDEDLLGPPSKKPRVILQNSADQAYRPGCTPKRKKPTRRTTYAEARRKVLKGGRPRREPSPEPQPDRFTPLPAEVRNQIYNYVLSQDVDFEPRDRWGPYKARPEMVQKPTKVQFRKWDKPGLLYVSKQIHHEALGVYLGLHHFKFLVSLPELEPLRKWISTMQQRYSTAQHQQGILPNYSIGFNRKARWDDIGLLFPLVRMVQENQMQNRLDGYPYKRLEDAANEVFDMATSYCSWDDWQEDELEGELEAEFEQWLVDQLQDCRGRPSARKAFEKTPLVGDVYGTYNDVELIPYRRPRNARKQQASDRKLLSMGSV